jgi:phosphoribosyl-ATP pyrophosphohydrolase/phosphoribosyl-AMP cyclohydrolase
MNNISDHFIFQLEEIIQERIDNPIKGSYTNSLLDGGRNLIAKKLIEESGELAVVLFIFMPIC